MAYDVGTWYTPDRPAPEGVVGGCGSKKTNKPHSVPYIDIEAMARDGLGLSNAELLTLSHLINGYLDPSHQSMSREAVLRAFYTLCDLLYVTSDHFLRLNQHLTHLRKLSAVRALNLLDAEPFLDSPSAPTFSEGSGMTYTRKTLNVARRGTRPFVPRNRRLPRQSHLRHRDRVNLRPPNNSFFVALTSGPGKERLSHETRVKKPRQALQASKVETSREVAVTATGTESMATKVAAEAATKNSNQRRE